MEGIAILITAIWVVGMAWVALGWQWLFTNPVFWPFPTWLRQGNGADK